MMRSLVTRRWVLQTAAASAAFTRFSQTPAIAQSADTALSLVAEKASSKLLGKDAAATAHWHFKTGGALPVLQATQGIETKLHVTNVLEEDLWLHFFGVRGASDSMTVQVPAGDANGVDIVFTPPDAGTFWFGPLINASRLRDMGLYGMLVVEEAGSVPAFADVLLILDDWKLSDDGMILQGFGDLEAAAGEGRLGNWFTVNNAFKPTFELPKGKPVRLRLLNVANTRTMNVLFKGCDLAIIARDGQPVKPAALGPEALKVAPGQRVDLLITDATDQIVLALDLFEDVVEAAFFSSSGLTKVPSPETLALKGNPLAVVDATVVPRAVPLVLEGGLKGGLKSAKVGDQVLDLRQLLEKGLAWAINGQAGPGSAPLFEAKLGETIILDIDNRTSFEQVLHIHGHVWHQLEQDGKVVEGQSWRDTAVIPGLTVAKYLFVADNPGAWAIQSLQAERCDAGLLGSFTVANMP